MSYATEKYQSLQGHIQVMWCAGLFGAKGRRVCNLFVPHSNTLHRTHCVLRNTVLVPTTTRPSSALSVVHAVLRLLHRSTECCFGQRNSTLAKGRGLNLVTLQRAALFVVGA